MKLDILDDCYIYFTNDLEIFSGFNDIAEEEIAEFVKSIFVNLNNIYNVVLFGYYNLDIVIDPKIGAFVEIKLLDNYISFNKRLDTKVNISVKNFYLETNDLWLINQYRPIYKLGDNYGVSTKDLKEQDIINLADFCTLFYKDDGLECIFN